MSSYYSEGGGYGEGWYGGGPDAPDPGFHSVADKSPLLHMLGGPTPGIPEPPMPGQMRSMMAASYSPRWSRLIEAALIAPRMASLFDHYQPPS